MSRKSRDSNNILLKNGKISDQIATNTDANSQSVIKEVFNEGDMQTVDSAEPFKDSLTGGKLKSKMHATDFRSQEVATGSFKAKYPVTAVI